MSVGDKDAVTAFLARTPLSTGALEEILELFCGGREYLPGKSKEEKLAKLRAINYMDFLTDIVGVSWRRSSTFSGCGVAVTWATALT